MALLLITAPLAVQPLAVVHHKREAAGHARTEVTAGAT